MPTVTSRLFLFHLFATSFLMAIANANVVISEFLAANDTIAVSNAVAGRFDDWIEIQNPTGTAEDISGWHLTDDAAELNAWTFPVGTTVPANDTIIVFASGDGIPDTNGNLHTNFRLSSGGEHLALVRPDNSIASEFGPGGTLFPPQSPDISYGLHPNTSESVFFSTPTPGAANDPAGIARVAELEVSPRRGLYQSAQLITLITSTPGSTIYYTTDGTPPVTTNGTPTATASVYNTSISINQTTVIRSAATASGLSPSLEQTHTYLLLDIDNASLDGSDPAGLNTPLLQQTQPAGWGNLASGDYNMDQDITRSPNPSANHNGLSVAQAMLEGLREAPTISISMPKEEFIAIYANPTAEGISFERLCSTEFIPGLNDSRSDFQEHCGLRIQGGASRNPGRSPKHALSFRFREEYGAGRLRQALFPEVEVENFNSIALRSVYNNSWIHSDASQRARGSMIRDQWMRESLRDMGNEDAGAGFLAHVYINGLYWGLHNIAERQDNAHYSNYNGGDSELIDARNSSNFVEGDATAWNAMRSTVATKNWEDIQQVVDIDSYIDFQIVQRYGANSDLRVGNNWRAAGGGPFTDPTEMRPWKLYSWDSERVLESSSASNVPADPMEIRSTLETIPEYRQRFADRAYQHLTGDGALTSTNCQARWEKYASAIDKAIIAESARWGDHRQATPYDRDDWLTEQNRLYNSYFNVRTNTVINNLSNANLFPSLDPPVFSLNGQASQGGYVGGGNTLGLTAEDGTVYYTLDGSDPRLPDGNINPEALSAPSGGIPESIFPFESDGWTYLTNGIAQSTSNVVVGSPTYDTDDWKHPHFDDTAWNAGQGLFAGSNSTAVQGRVANTVFNLNSPNGRISTAYFRKEFQVTNASDVSSIDLSIIRDDGVIVYLNGYEIYRENMPDGTVSYSDFSAGSANETTVLEHSHPLSPGQLLEGTNVISVEVHNSSLGNIDLGLDVAASVSRANLNLPQSGQLFARARSGTNWSAPATGLFLIEEPANSTNLVISEINYHPREVTLVEFAEALPLSLEGDTPFEFIELLNIGNTFINLAGASFTEGIAFSFGLHVLAPGEHGIIVRERDGFAARYGNSLDDKIFGTYSGSLSNSGETITLVGSAGSTITFIAYSDSGTWPSRPDGFGSSLEFANFTGNPDNSSNWKPSITFDGSPGITGPLSDQRIVINEVSTNSTTDFIELYNTTASPIDLGGWLLTDNKSTYQSYLFPPTTLGALNYLVIPATAFNSASFSNPITTYSAAGIPGFTIIENPEHGLTNGDYITISGYGGLGAYNESFQIFAESPDTFVIRSPFIDNHPTKGAWEEGRSFGLSASNGDDLWLLETDENGNPLAFVDHVDFAAAAPDTTLGRWPDGMGSDTLVTMTTDTTGATNSGPLLGPVFITEVHYAPLGIDAHEFVELTNTGTTALSLNQWRLRGGLDFDFTTTHSLSTGQSLVVVTFDPALQTALASDFRTTFNISPSVLLVGPATDGPLNNNSGTVRLQQAGPSPEFAQITIDEVRYLASPPWPIANTGNSLTRSAALSFGNFDQSWLSATPTPGSFIQQEDYATWAIANGVGSGELDDDGDFLSNFLEFALGSDPNSPTRLPDASFENGTVTISFPSHLSRTGFTLTLETSPDLKIWTPRQTTPGIIEGPIQTSTLNLPYPENQKLFWHLIATPTGN